MGEPASKQRAEREIEAADAAPTREQEPERVHLHMPVNVRSLSLIVLTVLACIFALQWARPILVPILLGVMFSYALTPAVNRIEHWRVPRALAATLVLGGAIAVVVWGISALADDATAMAENLPLAAQKLRRSVEGHKAGALPIDKVQQAAAELEQAAHAAEAAAASAAASAATSAAASAAPEAARSRAPGARATTTTTTVTPIVAEPSRAVTRVVVERPAFSVHEYLWSGTVGLFVVAGQLAIVLFVTLFLLASGDTFRRKMVKLAGPRLSQKKITVQALDEIGLQIQRYLLVQLATSVVVGVATGVVFYALGLNNAAVWGVAAGVTNLVPYLGALVLGSVSAIAGFVQFDSIEHALLIGASSFAIHGVVGNVLTPWWTGRASRMSPFAVFVGVLAFGWLWGAAGLILGTPILMVTKTVCDRIDELKPVGEFLGA